MKAIKINTPEGQYLLDIRYVAEQRADYYACEVDGYEKGTPEWSEEYEYTINDSFEAIDWLGNNSDWVDWQDKAIPLNKIVKVTVDDFWFDSDNFEMVDEKDYLQIEFPNTLKRRKRKKENA